MKKFRFKLEQRYALWVTYNKKCFYCSEPIKFNELTIDHVLPEFLLKDPEELKSVKEEYGLDDNFLINGYCNWVPSHNHCNREKGGKIFNASPAMIKTLAIVGKKANMAEAEEEKITKSLENGELLVKLGVAYQKGTLRKEEWIAKIELDYNQEIKQIELDSEYYKVEAARKNDAIAFLRVEREYAWKKKRAEEKRELAIAYVKAIV